MPDRYSENLSALGHANATVRPPWSCELLCSLASAQEADFPALWSGEHRVFEL